MARQSSDEFFPQVADHAQPVPQPATPGRVVAVAHADFLAIHGPPAGVAQATGATGGDAQRGNGLKRTCAFHRRTLKS